MRSDASFLREGGVAPYDRFRDRIILAIADGRGRKVSFGGVPDAEARAKHLNGPKSPLFHKGRMDLVARS